MRFFRDFLALNLNDSNTTSNLIILCRAMLLEPPAAEVIYERLNFSFLLSLAVLGAIKTNIHDGQS